MLQIQLDALKRAQLLRIETRDQLKELEALEESETIKDILGHGVLQFNALIAEKEVEISEIELLISAGITSLTY